MAVPYVRFVQKRADAEIYFCQLVHPHRSPDLALAYSANSALRRWLGAARIFVRIARSSSEASSRLRSIFFAGLRQDLFPWVLGGRRGGTAKARRASARRRHQAGARVTSWASIGRGKSDWLPLDARRGTSPQGRL